MNNKIKNIYKAYYKKTIYIEKEYKKLLNGLYKTMNIFILDYDIQKCAQYHVDRHCIKMILETSQLLSTALHEHNISFIGQYKKTHHNHPSNVWARKSRENFEWLCELGIYLGEEYTYRYGKIHKSIEVIKKAKEYTNKIPSLGLTPFTLAMPDEYKRPDAVEAYRTYYRGSKGHLFNYTKRKPPEWLNDLPVIFKE